MEQPLDLLLPLFGNLLIHLTVGLSNAITDSEILRINPYIIDR